MITDTACFNCGSHEQQLQSLNACVAVSTCTCGTFILETLEPIHSYEPQGDDHGTV